MEEPIFIKFGIEVDYDLDWYVWTTQTKPVADTIRHICIHISLTLICKFTYLQNFKTLLERDLWIAMLLVLSQWIIILKHNLSMFSVTETETDELGN